MTIRKRGPSLNNANFRCTYFITHHLVLQTKIIKKNFYDLRYLLFKTFENNGS